MAQTTRQVMSIAPRLPGALRRDRPPGRTPGAGAPKHRKRRPALSLHVVDHGTVSAGFPEGWTIERVRRVSGDSGATVLSLERRVRVLEARSSASYVPLQPGVILSFHDLCLVRADDDWYMGLLGADGSIDCWASYGPDLQEAIRGL